MQSKIPFFQRILSVFLILVFSNLPVLAIQETPKQIKMKAGGPAITVNGSVSKDKEVVYVFNAKAGQKFSGRLIKKAGNIGFEVTDPDGEGLPEEEYDYNTKLNGTLEKTGTYKITVATFETKSSRYTLSVRIY